MASKDSGDHCEQKLKADLAAARDEACAQIPAPPGVEISTECHNKLVCQLAEKLKCCLKKVTDPNTDVKPQCVEEFLDKLTIELVQINLKCPQKEAWCLCFLVNVHQRAQAKLEFRIPECPYQRWARVKKAFLEKAKASGELHIVTEAVTTKAKDLSLEEKHETTVMES